MRSCVRNAFPALLPLLRDAGGVDGQVVCTRNRVVCLSLAWASFANVMYGVIEQREKAHGDQLSHGLRADSWDVIRSTSKNVLEEQDSSLLILKSTGNLKMQPGSIVALVKGLATWGWKSQHLDKHFSHTVKKQIVGNVDIRFIFSRFKS